jgi:DNA repair photolyase
MEILEKFKNIEVGFSITTADEKIREIFEPGASPIKERIRALDVLHSSRYAIPIESRKPMRRRS